MIILQLKFISSWIILIFHWQNVPVPGTGIEDGEQRCSIHEYKVILFKSLTSQQCSCKMCAVQVVNVVCAVGKMFFNEMPNWNHN